MPRAPRALLLASSRRPLWSVCLSLTSYRQRENAEEGQYIKRKEAEQLKAAQEKKAAAEKEIVRRSLLLVWS